MTDPSTLSTTLYGEEGSLSWTVTPAGTELHLAGRSPSWRVAHVATRGFVPILTERVDDRGHRTVIRWLDTLVTVTSGDHVRELDEPGLWDTDVIDVRLGYELARGRTHFAFRGLHPKSGALYDFAGEVVDTEPIAGEPCRHVLLRVAGVIGWVAPTWHYWYDATGRLRQFHGPAGKFGPKPD